MTVPFLCHLIWVSASFVSCVKDTAETSELLLQAVDELRKLFPAIKGFLPGQEHIRIDVPYMVWYNISGMKNVLSDDLRR